MLNVDLKIISKALSEKLKKVLPDLFSPQLMAYVDSAILIEKSFGNSLKFHSNLLFKNNKTKFFPSFYWEIMLNWERHFAMMAEITSCILSQYLWYNKSIQVDKVSIHFLTFSEKSINYVSQLFSDNGSIKKWHEFKREYNLHESSYFKWLQLVDSIPERWKFVIKENYENATNLIIHDHHLIKDSRVITLDKLTSTEIYSIIPMGDLSVQNLKQGPIS